MNRVFSKLLLFPALLIAGCIFSGLYGVLHDQLTYTLSPDYFHAFKFLTFKIPASLHNRLGAAVVGWQATWWMGPVIGVPVLAVGLLLPDWKSYLKHSLIAFALVAATALIIGLATLVYASITIDAAHLPPYWYPDAPIDKVAFARVGTMHNFSYRGGLFGIATAVCYLVFVRLWFWYRNVGHR